MTRSHDTLNFSRTIEAPLNRVWEAYVDIDARSRWSVPAGEHIVYDNADFTSGGIDTFRCGPPGHLNNAGTCLYHLVEPQRRFLYTDTVHRDGELMAAALLSWELEAIGESTRITVVDQVTSLVGQGMIDGHRNGHNKTFDRLTTYLTTQRPQRTKERS